MSKIVLDKNNLYHNLNQLSLKIGNTSKLAAVLKDNAYGHGLVPMAKLISEYGVSEAVVISTKEALMIKEYFNNILVLDDKPQIVKKFSYSITSLEALREVSKYVKIELKVDTGMHRNGITLDEVEAAIEIIKSKGLNLFGVFTHFRSADTIGSELFWQKRNFAVVKEQFLDAGFDVRFHSHNSAATLRSVNGIDGEDIARVGIAMYGYNELSSSFNEVILKPVLSLWADKISSRVLKKGQRVGYSGDFIANRDMIVSTYDIGYGDGLFRGDSRDSLELQNGQKILGRVSMDSISIESNKDEVCIFNDAQKVAKHFNTISYEIVTSLKDDIQRVVN